MSVAIERGFEPISVRAAGGKIELHIGGSGPHGDGNRYTYLSPKEARILAYELLHKAEKLST